VTRSQLSRYGCLILVAVVLLAFYVAVFNGLGSTH
jgi:hypothetical protein